MSKATFAAPVPRAGRSQSATRPLLPPAPTPAPVPVRGTVTARTKICPAAKRLRCNRCRVCCCNTRRRRRASSSTSAGRTVPNEYNSGLCAFAGTRNLYGHHRRTPPHRDDVQLAYRVDRRRAVSIPHLRSARVFLRYDGPNLRVRFFTVPIFVFLPAPSPRSRFSYATYSDLSFNVYMNVINAHGNYAENFKKPM